MAITSLEGPSVYPDLPVAGRVAVDAENRECALGRPLELIVCDDKWDPNLSTECGRQAVEDGVVALVGSLSASDNGYQVTADAGIPTLFNFGISQLEASSPLSYPGSSAMNLVLGGVTAAKSLGHESALLVTVDIPAAHFVADQAQAIAEDNEIDFDTLFFPPETTDFAPVAAQIATAGADAIGLAVGGPQLEPLFGALAGEGVDLGETDAVLAGAALPPHLVSALGDDIEGAYVLSGQFPPSATDNPGIRQMASEYQAAGEDLGAGDATVVAVNMWSAVHSFADLLEGLGADALEDLDGAAVVDAVEAAAPIDRPETNTLDFSGPAFADDPALSALRIFTTDVLVSQIRDGELRPVVPDFVRATEPFEIAE